MKINSDTLSQYTFHSPSINDKDWYLPIIENENTQDCTHSFGNVFMWRFGFTRQIMRFNTGVISKFSDGKDIFYSYPIGCTDVKDAIDYIISDCRKENTQLKFISLSENQKEIIESILPNAFTFFESRDYEDYIYDIESLATYSGKKYHAKKNHCNKFCAEYDWSFKPLSLNSLEQCRKTLDIWLEENKERLTDDISLEKLAINEAFCNYESLELIGGALYVNDDMIAFSIGEKINNDTYDIHFEKALTSFNGSYSMICREFSKYIKEIDPEIRYLNREDDMGNLSLRKSKESYHPDYMLKKYLGVYNYEF